MDNPDKKVIGTLEESGCLSFLHAEGKKLSSALEDAVPEGWGLLAEDAVEALEKTFRERLLILYLQPLMAELRKGMQKYDPVGVMLGRSSPEALKKAAEDFCREAGAEGSLQEWLHAHYPLLSGYRENICRNTETAFREFFERMTAVRDRISEQLLHGNPFRKILNLSAGGADMHRHGRCVIGVTTDAGKFYYKPHDCGPDALYERIVDRWFSDCTEAPKVIGGGGFAFVSALVQKPVCSEQEVSDYFYHFGILTALFHGLGSNDMHQENIMACGTKPSAIDLETLVNVSYGKTEEEEKPVGRAGKDMMASVTRIGILPARIYKSGLISPLYCSTESIVSLPELDGKRITVEGYEDVFRRGFGEGYRRMLAHREEIREMLEEYRHAAVRILLRNTAFYAHIRRILYRPEYLLTEEGRQAVYEKLCSPYKTAGIETDRELTAYEWKSLLQGDIPYYCTALDSRDICGENPGEVLKQDFYQQSALESTMHFLDRLSAEEERFEQEMIRVSFAHAPLDVPKEEEPEAVSEKAAGRKEVSEAVKDICAGLEAERIRCTDGSPLWISMAEALEIAASCGRASGLGGAGAFFAALQQSGAFPELEEEAGKAAGDCAAHILKDLEIWEEIEPQENGSFLPSGLYYGIGGLLLALCRMSAAGTAEAKKAAAKVISLVFRKKLYTFRKSSAAEGCAGLVLALAAAVSKYGEVLFPCPQEGQDGSAESVFQAKECIRICADRLLQELPAEHADLPCGNAGYGAALAAAYEVSRDLRCAEGALRAFQRVEEAYNEHLSGWPDSGAKVKSLADRGPHAAGIYLTAAFASEKLEGIKDADVTERVCSLALTALMSEKYLLHTDTVNQGSALSVLALLKAGKRTEAGRILSAMLKRRERKGCFTVTAPGIRSAFDPSYYVGTLGIGYVMIKYIADSGEV